MRWTLILTEFGPHIFHIAGVDKIVDDTLSHLKSINDEEDENDVPVDIKLQELYANNKI